MSEKPEEKMDLAEFLEELDAGVFANKVTSALKATALGVATWGDKGRKGSVTVTFDMKRIGESNQVELTHAIKYSRPTKRGKTTEDDATQTPLHVGAGGKLSLFPDTQQKFEFDGGRDTSRRSR